LTSPTTKDDYDSHDEGRAGDDQSENKGGEPPFKPHAKGHAKGLTGDR
jgi:hypothetical protein